MNQIWDDCITVGYRISKNVQTLEITLKKIIIYWNRLLNSSFRWFLILPSHYCLNVIYLPIWVFLGNLKLMMSQIRSLFQNFEKLTQKRIFHLKKYVAAGFELLVNAWL